MHFNCLSLFSSAGIAETYFSKHNIDVKVASEILPERVRLYRHLYPNVNMIEGDISDKKIFNSIYHASVKSNVDFIIATPPCQGMSTAGLQRKDDARNRLIIYAVKLIELIKPKFAIIENVPNILNTKIYIDSEWVLIDDYIRGHLGKLYNFNNKQVVNSVNYGVAQSRERCVYLLSNKSFNFIWEFPPSNKTELTMRDVIGDLPSLDPEVTDISNEKFTSLFPNFLTKKTEGEKISKWHTPPRHKYRHVVAMMHTPEGNTAWNNRIYYPKLANGKKSKGYKNTYKRQWWDKPAYTITKYTSRIGSQENGHPGYAISDSNIEEKRIWSDPRVLTIFELMRLSSLPDNWNIPDDTSSNLIREVIGEGVPPKLIEAALISLEQRLEDEI